MGTDQYPGTTEKAIVLLGNYKPPCQQQHHQPRDDGGVAFIKRGRGNSGGRGRGDRGGRSGGAGRGNPTVVSAISEEGSVARSNCNGETHCFHCGEEGHWENTCPLLLGERQSKLQMNIIVEDEAADKENEDEKEKGGFMGIQVAMLQGKGLPSNMAYLNNCSTVTAFRTAKCIRNIKTKKRGMQVNCNAGRIKQTEKGSMDKLKHGTCQRE